jgi:MFS family permease
MATESLWRNRNFRVFLTVQTLSSLGDSFSYVAIPLLVLHTTGSVTQMGLVTATTGVASIVTGLFAGLIADRTDRRRLLMICDAARCLLYGLIPLAWLFASPVWLVYAVVPLAGAFSMIFQVTYVTVVPAIVAPGEITKANGHLYASYAMAGVGGPALAGVMASAFGPAWAIAVDAVSFAVSAVGVVLVRVGTDSGGESGSASESESGKAPVRNGVRGEFLAGARFLWAHPVLRPLTVLLSLLTFLTFGLTDVIVYRLRHDLGHPDGTVGVVLSVGIIGTFAASALVARVRDRLGFGGSWIGAYTLAGVAVGCLAITTSVPVIAALGALVLFCTGTAGICSMSLRQEVTPGHLLGRVTSAFWTIHSALGPLGAAAVTAAVAGFGVPATCLVVGSGMLLIALTGTLTGIRGGAAVPAPATR